MNVSLKKLTDALNRLQAQITALSPGGGVQSVVAGSGISVDDTDPANPVVSATGAGTAGNRAYVSNGTVYSTTSTIAFSGSAFSNTTGAALPDFDLVITPVSADSLLKITFSAMTGNTSGSGTRFAFFIDSETEARFVYVPDTPTQQGTAVFVIPSPGTGTYTFKIRWGTASGTGYLGAINSATAPYDAKCLTSFLIEEI